jgi:PP-loop superfamily ATP-utilizing enzyme
LRIVAAMSGGVDSSVAAALLAEQGHDVIGLSMQLYDQSGSQSFGSCCTLDDLHDARRVAAARGFPHYIMNFERQFNETVISNFVNEYTSGRTPIPCAHCNSNLKFSTLLDRARGLGADVVATGHYARVEQAAGGRYLLRRSVDLDKDQSYFLFSLTQDQLSRAVFPVGALTKPAVRAEAHRLGLTVAEKPDSQEICFVPSGDYAAFVESRSSVRPGAVVNQQGEQLLHDRPEEGPQHRDAGPDVRPEDRRGVRRRHRWPPRRARPNQLHRVRSELDRSRRHARVDVGLRPDPPSSSPSRRAGTSPRGRSSRVRVRRATARRHTGAGRRLLRPRCRHRRRVD